MRRLLFAVGLFLLSLGAVSATKKLDDNKSKPNDSGLFVSDYDPAENTSAAFAAMVAPENAKENPNPFSNKASKNLVVSFPKDKGVKFSTPDDYNFMRLSGYFQLDNANFYGDRHDTVHNTQNFKNGAYVPSARIDVIGAVERLWKYRFEYDLAVSRLDYAYVSYIGLRHWMLMAGQYKPSFSVESGTERLDHTYLEHALPDHAFSPYYDIGVQALFYDHAWTATAGVFLPDAENKVNDIYVHTSAPVAVNGRVTYMPVRGHNYFLMLGLGDYVRQAINDDSAQFNAYPELLSNGGNHRFLVDTGVINQVKYYNVATAELLQAVGSFSMEGEYYLTDVNRNGLAELQFQGGFLSLDYFLTGETHIFDQYEGRYLGISKILHSYGAWEIATRFSYLDLDRQNILGGKEQDYTVALNWYPIQRVKLALNYIHAFSYPSENGLDRTLNEIGLMLQVHF